MTRKQTALRILGNAISSVIGSSVLKAVAALDPARHLYDLDGGVYMYRWHVVREGSLTSKLLERLTGYTSIRLHRIMRADHDRDLHNHPFTYRTFVVRGYYFEQYQDFQQRVKNRHIGTGASHINTPTTFHRIGNVAEGGVWTLFCMTRNTGSWGFKVAGRFHSSTRYLLNKGYRQPGKDVPA